MSAGRPTDYSEEILKQTEEYLEGCIDTFKKDYTQVNLPSIYGLARHLKINRDTIYEWAKIHQEFSDTLREIENEQAKRLINEGLAGTYNSLIAKLILSANHGMKERTDTTTNDKDLPNPIYNGKSTE